MSVCVYVSIFVFFRQFSEFIYTKQNTTMYYNKYSLSLLCQLCYYYYYNTVIIKLLQNPY